MSFFQWDPKKYSVNVDKMDREHEILIEKMNALYDAFDSGESFELTSQLLNDFAIYTATHFQDEETFMESIGYKEIENHKRIHKKILELFQEHLANFNENRELSLDFFDFLKNWLTTHIQGVDAKYGRVAKNKVA